MELPFAVTGSEYEKLLPDMHVGYSPEIVGRYGRVGVAKYELSTGDIVYLDGGRARGLTPGSIFMAVVPDRVVIHPVTKQPFGRYYHYAARVRVLSVQEATAIGEIVQSCDPIRIGTRLQPYEPEPVPLGRPTGMRPINFPTAEEKLQAAPVVLFAKDDVISLGQDHVVYIDRGADQVTPGDVFTIYRLNRAGSPPMPIGELAVLSVHKTSAVAKIIAARYPIYLGDRLDPK